jgi:hypothetical protein
MIIAKKKFNKYIKGAIALVPTIPFVTRRHRSSLLSYVIGGLGMALAGGLVAVMFLSPRTRYRAIGMAKQAYGKIKPPGDVEQHQQTRLSDGLVNPETGTGYTTGL